MRSADDRILEVMRDRGNMTPRAVSREGEVPRVDITRDYAGNRLRILTKYGMTRRLDRGLYAITETGIAYLDEELDADQLTTNEDIEE
jgi:hypothetical protein